MKQIIQMQIGYLFKVDKLEMEYVMIIIMDIQQDFAFKMVQIVLLVFGIQILLILVFVKSVNIFLLFFYY